MAMPGAKEAAGSDDADAIYLAYLRGRDRGDVDIEELCREHPEVEAALRRLHEAYVRLEALCSGQPELREVVIVAEAERYTILDEIGHGGMGTVYRVWDARLDQEVAMKVSFASTGSSGSTSRSARRFLDEARVMGQLDHPGVPPVHDIGIDDEGRVFFTMQLVRGHELGEIGELVRAEHEDWTLHRLVGVLVQICETLAFAHARGIVHRDLKPSNVMVGHLGEVFVMDWGLARTLEGDDRAVEGPDAARVAKPGSRASDRARLPTLAGSVVGTPNYMAPEQARGDVKLIGPRTDVYALGGLIYHVLAGRAPYADSDDSMDGAALLQAVRTGPPTSIVALAPNAPPELCAICEKAMARDAWARYSNPRALANDLRAFLENRVVAAWHTGPWIELRKWIRRNRLAAAAIAATATVLVLGASALAWIETDRRVELDRANAELRNATDLAQDERARADREAYAAHLAAAQAWIHQDRADLAGTQLDACDPALRGWEWHHLDMRVDRSLATWPQPSLEGTAVLGLAFSGGGTSLVAARGSTVFAWSGVPGEPQRPLFSAEGPISYLALAPGGDRLAVVTMGSRVVIVDPSAPEAPVVVDVGSSLNDVSFHPDGASLLVACADGRALVFDLAGQRRAALDQRPEPVLSAAFSPDGRWVLTSSTTCVLRVFDAESGTLERSRSGIGGVDYAYHRWPARFDPSGRRIAAGTNQGDVLILNAETLDVLHVLRGHRGRVWDVAFDPRGERLASTSEDDSVRVWDAATGAEAFVGRGHRSSVWRAAWSPDGARLATAGNDGLVKVWDPLEPREHDRLFLGLTHLRSIDCDPSGSWIATGGPAPGVLLWDACTGDLVDRLSWSNEEAVDCRFDPTGSRLVTSSTTERVFVWNVESRDLERILTATPGHWTYKLDIHPDGRRVAVGSDDGSVWVWDLTTGDLVERLEFERRIGAVGFDPEGSTLAVGLAGGDLVLVDVESLVPLARVSPAHESRVDGVAFDPSGRILASVGQEADARLWDARTLAPLGVLSGHSDFLMSLAMHPDGTRLATGGRDGSIKIWDFAKRHELATLDGGGDWIGSLAFTVDGSSLVSAGMYQATLWDTQREGRGLEAVYRARAAVTPLVEALAQTLRAGPAVEAAISARADLDPIERRAALGLARSVPDGRRLLADDAFAIAVEGGLERAEYERALSLANTAIENELVRPSALDARGAALFRLDRPREAIDAFTEAARLRDGRDEPPDPGGLVFLAAAHAAIGQLSVAAEHAEEAARARAESRAPNGWQALFDDLLGAHR